MANNTTAEVYVQPVQLCDKCGQFLTIDNFPTHCLPYGAPSGSSSVFGPPNTLDGDASTSMPPPEIIQHMCQMRQMNPHAAVIRAVRCPFVPGGWAVQFGGRREDDQAWCRQCWRASEMESEEPGIADGATEEKARQEGCLY